MRQLMASRIETVLGPLISISDEKALYFLGFEERGAHTKDIDRLKKKTQAAIVPGETVISASIKNEVQLYFSGALIDFKTPLMELGTPFQKQVWDALRKIPYGETRSYFDIACVIGQPTAVRAVARANATNLHILVTPCHRVINKHGGLGGYGAGLARKKWLLNLEKKSC